MDLHKDTLAVAEAPEYANTVFDLEKGTATVTWTEVNTCCGTTTGNLYQREVDMSELSPETLIRSAVKLLKIAEKMSE